MPRSAYTANPSRTILGNKMKRVKERMQMLEEDYELHPWTTTEKQIRPPSNYGHMRTTIYYIIQEDVLRK